VDKKKIILVDDSKVSAIALQAMFKEYTVLFADDFSSASEQLMEYRQDIVLAIINCDFLEKKYWGVLIEKIKTLFKDCRIIGISSSPIIQANATLMGADDIFDEVIVKESVIRERIVKVLRI